MGMGSLNGIFEPAPNWRWWKFNSIIMESQHCKPLLCPPFLFNRCEGFWARWRSLRLSFPQICPQNFPQIFSSKLVRFQTDRGHESSNASWINAFLRMLQILEKINTTTGFWRNQFGQIINYQRTLRLFVKILQHLFQESSSWKCNNPNQRFLLIRWN